MGPGARKRLAGTTVNLFLHQRAMSMDSGSAPSKSAVADLDNDITELG
jgi:hypothetical protein